MSADVAVLARIDGTEGDVGGKLINCRALQSRVAPSLVSLLSHRGVEGGERSGR